MINFSYTISPFLKKELNVLEDLRNSLLLELVSPKDELKYQWEATLDRIYFSLKIKNEALKKSEIANLMSPIGKQSLSAVEKDAIRYKSALDYIKQNWTYEPDENISIHQLIKLIAPVYPAFDANNKEFSTTLQFLQVKPEHPIIQAGLSFAMLYHILGRNEEAKRLATLFSYVFLYKHGYNFRNVLVLEEHFAEHGTALDGALMGAFNAKNLSPFLDFYIFAMEDQAKKAVGRIKHKRIETTYPESYFQLTERQKSVLSMLDKPGTRITNKIVQKQFRISQITASRELAKLAALGLLLSIGRGRSVYYTKA